MYITLLYRHAECFTGKYTTCKIHTQPHPALEWRIFLILTSEDIDDIDASLSLRLYLISLVYDRNMFGSSSKVFGNLRKISENFGKCSATFVRSSDQIFGNLRKSSESGRKSSENRQLRRH